MYFFPLFLTCLLYFSILALFKIFLWCIIMNEITSDWCTTEICESSENVFQCRRCVHILFWITFDWCISRWFMKNTLSLSNSLMECNCNFASAAQEMIYKLSSTFYYLLLLSLLMMHLKAIWNSDLKNASVY